MKYILAIIAAIISLAGYIWFVDTDFVYSLTALSIIILILISIFAIAYFRKTILPFCANRYFVIYLILTFSACFIHYKYMGIEKAYILERKNYKKEKFRTVKISRVSDWLNFGGGDHFIAVETDDLFIRKCLLKEKFGANAVFIENNDSLWIKINYEAHIAPKTFRIK